MATFGNTKKESTSIPNIKYLYSTKDIAKAELLGVLSADGDIRQDEVHDKNDIIASSMKGRNVVLKSKRPLTAHEVTMSDKSKAYWFNYK